jgi:hypothetical protein
MALAIWLLTGSAFAQVPSRDPGGIFDGMGGFNAEAYRDMANAWGTAAMIPERLGVGRRLPRL